MLSTKRNAQGGGEKGPLQTDQAVVMCFMPTARKSGVDPSNPAVRNTQVTYGVGYREALSIDSLGGAVWRWRRIAFNMKGSALRDAIDPPGDTGVAGYSFYDQTPEGGCQRLLLPMELAQQTPLFDFLFRGQQGVDWSALTIAKVDTSRVTLLSDRIRYIRPLTTAGTSRPFKFWYPIRHNIVYDDDKESNKVGDSAYSTSAKTGWGDMYIVDIFAPAITVTGQGISIDVEGTYYWHER
jgi:hypothetical protein